MVSTTPVFNLKVVLKETGLTADTLRAWERRYGLPVPQRTPGGHRLYSQRDIETIKWLMARQAEGLSISRAVDLWKEQLGSGSDPLAGIVSSVSSSMPEAAATRLIPETTLDTLRAHWIAACAEFNEASAEQILNQAFSMFPIEAVCVEVMQKGLSEIGGLWYENRASVQQEHFASGLAIRRLDALLSAAPMPTRDKIVVVGCPPDEWHTFTPLLLSLVLRRRGINVVYLGANIPAVRFADTVQGIKAELVVLAAQQLITAASLQQVSLVLANKGISVAFGGRIFDIHPHLARSIAGYFLGNDLDSAVQGIETLLNKTVRVHKPEAASQTYAAALQAYVARRAQIELAARKSLEQYMPSSEDIKTGLYFLGENIAAALQLGDMSYVSAEVDWLKTLLKFHDSRPEQLPHFMQTYSRAVGENINGLGKPISEWFSAELQKLKQ